MYIHIAQYLRSIMMKQQGVMQLIIEGYAQALEHIPTTLAHNAGLQSSGLIAEMRSKHAQFVSSGATLEEEEEEADNDTQQQQQPPTATDQSRFLQKSYPFMALNLRNGTICNNSVTDIQVVEPVSVMNQVLCKSMDAAEMIIRIDRNIFLRPEASSSDLGVL